MKKINENIKLIIGIIVAIVISSMISIKAATTLSSTSVYYDTSKSGGSSSNVNGAIDELYSLTTDREKLKTDIVNIIYPVGSIYMSTEDDTVEKVQDKFGGTWIKYSSGTTLVGDDGTNYITNDETKGSGGSSSVTLSTSNLPSHSHDVTAAGSVSSSFTGSSVTTSSSGSHTHGIRVNWGDGSGNIGFPDTPHTYYLKVDQGTTTNSAGNHTHTVIAKGTVSSTFTGSKVTSTSTGSGTSFSVQNPYTVVYMYKRTA